MRRPVRPLVALALGLAACTTDAPPSGRAAEGQPVPAYGARTLAGDSLSLADLRGSTVLLNIWATWCAPCRQEMPSFQRLHEEWGSRGLRIVAVSVDSESARPAVEEFVREYGLEFTILHDPAERVNAVFRPIGVPETYLIDREGRLVKRWIGEVDADGEAFRQFLSDLPLLSR